MSAIKETIITCDSAGPKCHGNDASADMRHQSASEQRKALRRDGWRHVGAKDYCPACWDMKLRGQLTR